MRWQHLTAAYHRPNCLPLFRWALSRAGGGQGQSLLFWGKFTSQTGRDPCQLGKIVFWTLTDLGVESDSTCLTSRVPGRVIYNSHLLPSHSKSGNADLQPGGNSNGRGQRQCGRCQSRWESGWETQACTARCSRQRPTENWEGSVHLLREKPLADFH